jgi:polysaccharide export outer membrane protein
VGDVLAIKVWGQDYFTRDCQVNAAGTILYPSLGDVPAAGMTCAELEERLKKGLLEFLKHPDVAVMVRQFGQLGGSVFVLGEVKNPGLYPLVSGVGIMQALAAAGGTTPQANGQITIIRGRTGESVLTGLEDALPGAPASASARPEPGDVILVNRRAEADLNRSYSVLGEVPTPGMFDIPLDGEVRVLEAMQKAGLLNSIPQTGGRSSGRPEDQVETADLAHSLLTRGDIVIPLDLAALLQGDISQNLPLQSGDVITVPRKSLICVYVMGEVRSPGRQLLPPEATLMDLLSAVGGVNSAAEIGNAALLRQVDGRPTPTSVDIGRLLRTGDPKQNPILRDGDMLFVPAKGESSRNYWRWIPLLPYLVRR